MKVPVIAVKLLLVFALAVFNFSSLFAANNAFETLDLEECITYLRSKNESLAALHHKVNAAAAASKVIGARSRVKVGLVSEFRYESVSQPLVPLVDPTARPAFGNDLSWQGMQVDLPFDLSGRLKADKGKARYQRLQSKAFLNQAQQQAVFQLRRHFYSILGGRERLKALQFSRETLQTHLKRLKRLQKAGRTLPIDGMRIEARIAAIDARILAERNTTNAHLRQIRLLLAFDEPLEIDGQLKSPELPKEPLETLLARALVSRPDLAALQSSADGAVEGLRSAKSARKADLSLWANWGRRQLLDDGLSGEGKTMGTVALSLSWPLFSGGALRAKQRQAHQLLEAEKLNLSALKRRILSEVQQALDDLQSALARLDAQRRSASVADEALKRESASYEEGRSTLTDVLDAERALSDARSLRADANVDALVAKARVSLVIGKDE